MKKRHADPSSSTHRATARIDKAAVALARSGFDSPVPDSEILTAIDNPNRYKVVSELLDEIGVAVPI